MKALKIFVEVCVGVLMIAVALVVSIQVLARYALNTPMDWTEEGSRMLFAYLTFFGAALAFLYGRQLKVDALVHSMSRRGRAILGLISDLLGFAFWALVVYQSAGLLSTLHTMQKPVTGLPTSFHYAAVPLGGILVLVFLIRDVVGRIRVLTAASAGGE